MESPGPTTDAEETPGAVETPAETPEARDAELETFFASRSNLPGLLEFGRFDLYERVMDHPDFSRRLHELSDNPDRLRMRVARDNPSPPDSIAAGYRGAQEDVPYGGLLGRGTRHHSSTRAEIGEMTR